MVRDSIRALDILEARDDIDASRLGMVGASGGGFSSVFASAIDERVSVAAIACIINTHLSQIGDAAYGTGWDSWVDLCNQVPGLCTIGTVGDILACVAPRTLLVANATNDPGFPIAGAREVAMETRHHFEAEQNADAFTYTEVPGGHGFQPYMRAAVADFLVSKLIAGHQPEKEEGELSFAPQWTVPHNQATAERPQSTSPVPSEGTCLPEPVDTNAPVVAIARRRAAQLRQQRAPLSAESLENLLGPFPERTPLNVYVVNHVTLSDFHAQRLTFQTEPGITIDALLTLPLNWSDDLPPVLVMLDEGGKEQALKSPEVSYAQSRGWAVLLPDLRGTGESAASEFEVASAAWMLDRDLLNQRTWDTLRLVDYLSARYSSAQQIDKGRIVLWGTEAFGLIALLAAALDSRVAGVGVRGHTSLEDVMQPNIALTPMLFHHNLLETLDIPDLQEYIKPRPGLIGVAESDIPDALKTLGAGGRR
jgi:dienelactone hydrolase